MIVPFQEKKGVSTIKGDTSHQGLFLDSSAIGIFFANGAWICEREGTRNA